ncbi:DUF882 domain-containing protein [Agrobacterium sp. ES01]|uniref:DUF882 domain-containing protein n=1 Tax=Agrobacterium sp. ES01 TaxID=3420714 RepID=UPI003D0C0CA0
MFALFAFATVFGNPTQASAAETRSLKILFVHTGEKANIVFKRNGRYDAKGLKQLSNLLRDWRRNEPTKMDPRLFDLLWEVYRQSGARDYIYAVSGYRSPQTNAMLRSRSKGVAKESQHMKGTAVDFYIPGVPLKRLREIGMKMQAGGVGYYPNSGSPFVHMDVAGVRAWPRMSRSELSRLFPDGKTLHIPSDGRPLPGYQQAMAEYKRRVASNTVVIADGGGRSKPKNLFAMLFGGGDEDEEEDVVTPAERPTFVSNNPPGVAAPPPPVLAPAPPAQAMVASLDAPVPLSRPSLGSSNGESLAVALYSPARSAAEDALTQVAAASPVEQKGDDFTDLSSYQIPVPTLLGPRGMRGDAQPEVMTASVASDMIVPQKEEMLGIPVPSDRPSVAEALETANVGAEEAEADAVEQAILSPEAAEAMAMAETGSQASVATYVVVPPEPRPDRKAEKVQTQMASLTPPVPAKRAVEFGDGFDTPKPSSAGLQAGLPTKGARPTENEADVARMAMYGGTSLTKKMISEWALNNSHNVSSSKAFKAPRVVTRSLTAAPAETYSVGFESEPVEIDPGRFGSIKKN